MKPSVMLFFTILGIFATFLLCAGASLVGVTMSYGRSNRYGGWDQNPPPKTAVVLVAREDIPAGTKIARAEDKFRVRIYRIGEEPRDAVSDYSQIGGMVLTRGMYKGEVCTLRHLQQPQAVVPLPDSKRAFFIRTTANMVMPAGFIEPGARVDVSGQATSDQFGQGEFKVLAHDCLVLAVNQAAMGIRPDDGNDQPLGQISSITVAVSSEEAGALTAAMRQAALTVTLRAPKD